MANATPDNNEDKNLPIITEIFRDYLKENFNLTGEFLAELFCSSGMSEGKGSFLFVRSVSYTGSYFCFVRTWANNVVLQYDCRGERVVLSQSWAEQSRSLGLYGKYLASLVCSLLSVNCYTGRYDLMM